MSLINILENNKKPLTIKVPTLVSTVPLLTSRGLPRFPAQHDLITFPELTSLLPFLSVSTSPSILITRSSLSAPMTTSLTQVGLPLSPVAAPQGLVYCSTGRAIIFTRRGRGALTTAAVVGRLIWVQVSQMGLKVTLGVLWKYIVYLKL